jgi:hypothetical protein
MSPRAGASNKPTTPLMPATRPLARSNGAQIGRLDPGATVERSDALPGWVEVRETDGAQGWVPREAVFALRR